MARGSVLLTKGAIVPGVALVLFTLFAVLGFGWRSWEQRRRTGSTGFRGVSGQLGTTEWFAGVGFVVAMAAAIIAPVLQLVGVVSPVSVLHAPWSKRDDDAGPHRCLRLGA